VEHWFIRRYDCVSISLPVYQSVTRKTISYLCINQLPVNQSVTCVSISYLSAELSQSLHVHCTKLLLLFIYTHLPTNISTQHSSILLHLSPAQFRQHLGAGFTKYLTTIVRISYHNANAKVTTDLRRTPNIQYILRMAQGFLRYNSSAKS